MTANFWTVASYSYPNPFGEKNAQLAWRIFLSFANNSSYQAVKDHWQIPTNKPLLDHAAVESRKAAYEEFGLLYVLSGSENVVITPAGKQLIAAASAGNEEEFVWIGINLLLRYPLCGAPRRLRSTRQANFLIYWFFWAIMFDLDDYILWPEMERIICLVDDQPGAIQAVSDIKQLRAKISPIDKFPMPVEKTSGKFYNSLNQVLNHASLYDHLIIRTKIDDPYGSGNAVRKQSVADKYRDIVRLAMGTSASTTSLDCTEDGQFVSRMPMAPPAFTSEFDYFSYLGATVESMTATVSSASNAIPFIPYGSDTVTILTEGHHYERAFAGNIEGSISTLCRLSVGQRVIFSHDLGNTFRIKNKIRSANGLISLNVSQSLPIVDIGPIMPYFIEES